MLFCVQCLRTSCRSWVWRTAGICSPPVCTSRTLPSVCAASTSTAHHGNLGVMFNVLEGWIWLLRILLTLLVTYSCSYFFGHQHVLCQLLKVLFCFNYGFNKNMPNRVKEEVYTCSSHTVSESSISQSVIALFAFNVTSLWKKIF